MKKLGEVIGVDPGTVARWEHGQIPSAQALLDTADYLKVSLRWLVMGGQHPEKPLLAWGDEAELVALFRQLNPSGRRAYLEGLRETVQTIKNASAL